MITIPMTVTASSCVLPVTINSLDVQLNMEVEARYSPNPMYDGEYEVTPTGETQTLYTTGRTMAENVVINPIPSNYGLITWNGSVLTVS